ncbi:hypothetical protein NL492_26445, partial [Klebsiella pneumoniae]|nr:hypothetical protein [Klebsiella pneumoniae]
IKKNRGGMIINTTTMQAYSKIKEVFSKTSAEFYTFTPRGEKDINIVLKGMFPGVPGEKIIEEIKASGLSPTRLCEPTYEKQDSDPIYVIGF